MGVGETSSRGSDTRGNTLASNARSHTHTKQSSSAPSNVELAHSASRKRTTRWATARQALASLASKADISAQTSRARKAVGQGEISNVARAVAHNPMALLGMHLECVGLWIGQQEGVTAEGKLIQVETRKPLQRSKAVCHVVRLHQLLSTEVEDLPVAAADVACVGMQIEQAQLSQLGWQGVGWMDGRTRLRTRRPMDDRSVPSVVGPECAQ